MKILCTGAAGFIGSRLVPTLLHERHSVAVLKRKTSALKQLETHKDNVTVYDYVNYQDIENALQNYKPDLVIHLATLYINNHSKEEVQSLIDSNILFGTYILEAMQNTGVGKILNFGTRWQHIDNQRYNPANLYAATKQAFADILCWYNKNGIISKTLELCDTFGKNDTRKKIVSLLIDACQNKKSLDLSPGEQILDILYIDDLIDYVLDNIEKYSFFDNQTVQIIGTEIQLKDLGMLIEKQYGVKDFLRWGAKSYRKNEVMQPPLCKDIAAHTMRGNRNELSYNLEAVYTGQVSSMNVSPRKT